jgi:hypothetical protein
LIASKCDLPLVENLAVSDEGLERRLALVAPDPEIEDVARKDGAGKAGLERRDLRRREAAGACDRDAGKCVTREAVQDGTFV